MLNAHNIGARTTHIEAECVIESMPCSDCEHCIRAASRSTEQCVAREKCCSALEDTRAREYLNAILRNAVARTINKSPHGVVNRCVHDSSFRARQQPSMLREVACSNRAKSSALKHCAQFLLALMFECVCEAHDDDLCASASKFRCAAQKFVARNTQRGAIGRERPMHATHAAFRNRTHKRRQRNARFRNPSEEIIARLIRDRE